jgi:predicted enzyme related to lactoylglutathione lyase
VAGPGAARLAEVAAGDEVRFGRLAERSLSSGQFIVIDALRRELGTGTAVASPLAVADREEALADWLDTHGVAAAWDIAPALAAAGADIAWCERAGRAGVAGGIWMVWCQPARSPSWQDSGMERVLGIGGYFMRAADPAALSAWYRDCLGLDADENGLWRQGAGLTVFATFESETGYFGSRAQQAMLNFRVRDLDAMLAQLRAKGADVAKETQDMEGVGRFGWVTDPEGNRVELWQPA